MICLDLGATQIKVALVENGKIVGGVEKVSTDADLGKDGIVAALKKAVEMFLNGNEQGVAVASAGNIDSDKRLITYATENLPGMTGCSFADFFLQNYGLPCVVVNDAHAALLGEMYFGAGRKFFEKRVAMLTLGSGVGGAYFANGAIVSDESNDYCRFGHVCLEQNGILCTCGKRGCAEMYLSGRALHRKAQELGVDGADAFCPCSDDKRKDFVGYFRNTLKKTLQKVSDICPFDVCIIGGGVVDWIGENFLGLTEDLGYDIVRANLGNDAGIFGTYAFANMRQCGF